MKITKLQYVTGLLVFISCLYIFGVIFSIDPVVNFSRAFILPFFVYLYFTESDIKSKFFALFLISCAFAECVNAIIYLEPYVLYRVSSLAYIFGYINLLIHIAKGFNLKRLFIKYKVPIVVLTIFNGYLIYILNQMILADTTIEVYTLNFLMECIYNVCILLVLSFSLLNYLYHDTKKGLLLFFASVCIVFSEVVKVAYVFVSSEYILNVIYSIFLIVGFSLVYFYITSKINTYYKVLF